jgi:NTE family protein
MKNGKRIGLSLSGGGYRAAAFHLGTLSKLNELNILDKVDVISTISGGSIAGAFYMLNKDDFSKFKTIFIKTLQKSVINKILFSRRIIITIVILLLTITSLIFLFIKLKMWLAIFGLIFLIIILFSFFQFFFLPISRLKEKAYRKLFFGMKKLSDLPESPIIAINSTNLETGTLFTFSKKKVSDSSYEHPKDGGKKITFKPDTINVSFAVACSTAVPVPFNPFKLSSNNFSNPEDYFRISPSLSDGGLYDNQGIHKLTQPDSTYKCDIIICSDGSQPFKFSYRGFNSFSVLKRSTDIMMRKIKSLQFIRDVYSKEKPIAYFSLDWEYERCITSFIRAVKEDRITEDLLKQLKFSNELINEIKIDDIEKSKAYLKQLIGYSGIIANGISEEDAKSINGIKTNLTALSERQIELLSKHAAALLEIQINLYCPMLLL